ncbi:MAG TPA: benzoate-CoA ligase family protein, partial [Afifellaceae bacterium]|nr:benzoate-CoA ligase family protein [Afifellaceae bacterium]
MTYPRDYNAAVDFIDRNVAEGRADKPAFIDPRRTLTYGGLQAATNRMANLLAAHGMTREDRVAMIVLDTIDFPTIFFGAIRAGVVPVAVNTLLATDQYRHILEDSRARALFVSEPLLKTVAPALDGLEALNTVFVVGGEAGDYVDFGAELAKQSDAFTIAHTCADEVAFWLYSSGSTGMPKGVPHVQTSMMETARLYGQAVLGVVEDDTVFSAAKLFFAYGLGNGMSFPMSVGATTILLPGRPTPAAVFDVLKTHQPTIFYGVPTLYAAMLAHPGCGPEIGSSNLRQCVSAGEALPEEVGKSWARIFNVDILDGVGSTELLHIFLSNAPGDVVYGTSGRAVPGYDLRLVDEHGAEVEDDTIGELLVRGTSAANGYWNQRVKSRATFEGEWTRT